MGTRYEPRVRYCKELRPVDVTIWIAKWPLFGVRERSILPISIKHRQMLVGDELNDGDGERETYLLCSAVEVADVKVPA